LAQVCRQSFLDGMFVCCSCHFFVCPVTTGGLIVTYCGLSSEFMMRFRLCLLFLDRTFQSSVII
jgi:hypothetical protein